MNHTTGGFYGGVLGGLLVLILIIITVRIFVPNYFTYKIKIVNPDQIEKIEKYSTKAKIIKELEKDGILLTPSEYTSHIAEQYNTTITILTVMLLFFSVATYINVKYISENKLKELAEELLTNSKSIDKIIKESIIGSTEEKFAQIDEVQLLRVELEQLKTEVEIKNNSIKDDESILSIEEDENGDSRSKT